MDINQLHQTRYQLLETAYTLQQQAAQLQQQLSDNAALQRNLAGQLQEVTAQINQAMQAPAPIEPGPDKLETLQELREYAEAHGKQPEVIESIELGDRTRLEGNTLHCDKCGSYQESAKPLAVMDVVRFINNHACKEASTATVTGEIIPDADGNVSIEI